MLNILIYTIVIIDKTQSTNLSIELDTVLLRDETSLSQLDPQLLTTEGSGPDGDHFYSI